MGSATFPLVKVTFCKKHVHQYILNLKEHANEFRVRMLMLQMNLVEIEIIECEFCEINHKSSLCSRLSDSV